ncbi:hypothetical protein QM042_02080 [Escherichia coli]|uniref:hypothetical protein n=1 Tax=Escherichia coli TaxID=562 RepID=UPI003986AF05
MIEKRAIHCQVQLTEKANDKLETFQNRLRERGAALSKADIIILLLECTGLGECDKIATSLEASGRVTEAAMAIYENSGMTKEDLADILKRLP